MRLRFLLVAVLLLMAASVQAKGPADRIIVTGPTIAGEMLLTLPETNYLLSFAVMEDFSAGAVDEPVSAGSTFYEMERQFLTNDGDFQTFDRSRFYPESGYVFYVGVEDGWSEYDNKWFHARPEARELIEAWFNLDAKPALVLMGASDIQFIDPSSLVELKRVALPGGVTRVLGFVDGPDAGTFDVTAVGVDGTAMDYRVDLVRRTLCEISQKRTSAADSVGIPWIVADVVAQQNRLFKLAHFEAIDVFSNRRALLYQPDSLMVDDPIPGGILVASLASGKQLDHWLPDHRFAEVIGGGEHLYALETLGDEVLLSQVNRSDGRVLRTMQLSADSWSLGYGLFDLSNLDHPVIELRLCQS